MNKQQVNLQDTFLNQVRKENIAVTIYLINSVQLRGLISWMLQRTGSERWSSMGQVNISRQQAPVRLQWPTRRSRLRRT